MRSLFLKIFLWFWGAVGLVVLLFLVVPWWTETGQPGPGWRGDIEELAAVYAEAAADVYARGGAPALAEYLARWEAESDSSAYLFGPDLTELAGRTPPAGAREAAAGGPRGGPGGPRPGPYMFVRRGVRGPAGEPLTFVVAFRLEPRGEAATLVVRALAVLLAVGALCYGLARYFTSPLERLRSATRKMAEGDLTARAGARARSRRDEFGELARDFDRMADRLEALVRHERQLLSDISHELRSPLARLGLAVGLLRDEPESDREEMLARIELEAERLDGLIGELLALARLQSAPSPARRTVDLAEVVSGVVADADFEACGLGRRVAAGALEPALVEGDEELLRSAVENVVRNAVRHTAEGTAVEVTLARREGPDAAEAVVTVRDQGTGVPESELESIFTPFYRVGEARDRQSGGAGLGLAIADRAVRIHAGRIEASNAEGGGLVVRLALPLA